MASSGQKSFCILFWLPCGKECNGAICMSLASCHAIISANGITWSQCQNQMHRMTKEVMLHFTLVILTKELQWCYWWCHWHHMKLMLGAMASHDQKCHFAYLLIIFTSQMEWWHWWQCWHHVTLTPASMALHDQKRCCCTLFQLSWSKMQWCYWPCHWHHMMLIPVPTGSNDWEINVASHFHHLELTNATVLLVMSSVSCDANTGITCPRSHVSPCFNHLDLTNKMVSMKVPSVSYNAQIGVNSITLPEMSHLVSIFLN